ncbi:histidinol-phosphate transaminase [Chachezhania sediminis]|uniref:histidinol-phosphate transaminase n=1 Tax=Chachezhania sediminis TaxID=2599291 RepID=UPI00131D14E0|nr:histidinol-phosphate transaminase [Chachezhania sediminis]
MSAPRPQPGILEITPYVGGASKVAGVENVIKLSSNENPSGPSPRAVEALKASAAELHRYPSTDHASLRQALGAHHGLDPARIFCGVGSDEVLMLLCQAYAGPGDEVIYSEYGFSLYPICALSVGAVPVAAKETERTVDVDQILSKVTSRTKIVFVANPNNPTGTMIGDEAIARLIAGLPEDVLIVLDGAYAEFVDGFDGGASFVEKHANVVMTRTFSKLYGLGGLRVGWGYGSADIIGVLNRIRQPFNLSAPALAAAEAALGDTEWVAETLAENVRLRTWLADALDKVGVPSDPSHANFILARFKDAAEAAACDAFLRQHGLIVRPMGSYNLNHTLRITIGTEDACIRVAETVATFKAQGA